MQQLFHLLGFKVNTAPQALPQQATMYRFCCPAQAAHLETIAGATQLRHLALWVYQATSRCLLDPLLQLSQLQHLDLAYKGGWSEQTCTAACHHQQQQASLMT